MIYYVLLYLLALIFIIDFSVHLPFYIPKYFIFTTGIIFLSLLYLISNVVRKRQVKLYYSLIEVLLIILLIWRFFTNFSFFIESGDYLWNIYIFLIILSFLSRQVSIEDKKQLINYLLKILWITGLFQALIGFYQLIQYSNSVIQSIKTPMIGTIGPPNGYASILTISLICLILDYTNYKNIYLKIFMILSAVIIFSALLINGSRGAFLSLISAIIVIFYFNYSGSNYFISVRKYFEKTIHKIYFLLLIILGFTILLIGLYFINPESSSGRFMIWEISLPMFTENLFSGIGYGNYGIDYLNYQAKYFSIPENLSLAYKAINLKQAHNEYLEVFCETGLIGGLIFLAIWIIILRALYILIVQNKNNGSGYISIFAIFISVIVHGFFDDPLHFLPTATIVFIFIGIIPLKNHLLNIHNLLLKISLFFAVFIFFIFSVINTIEQYSGYRLWQEGKVCIRNHRIEKGIESYLSALDRLRDSGELKFHIGSAYVLSGQYKFATKYLNESLENYNDRNIYLSLSRAYFKQGRLDRAEMEAKTALSMFPDHLAPHLLLGEIYFYRSEFTKSKNSLMKCIKAKTTIKSNLVTKIQNDAINLWRIFYGYSPI